MTCVECGRPATVRGCHGESAFCAECAERSLKCPQGHPTGEVDPRWEEALDDARRFVWAAGEWGRAKSRV